MRKIFAKVLVGVLLVSSLAVSSAAGQATENFYIYINGGEVLSSKEAEKTDTGRMLVGVDKMAGSSVNWLTSEWVNYRGRTSSGANATEANKINKPTTSLYDGSLYYLSGHGKNGAYYRMACHYDNNNPYTHLELTVTWRP